MQLDSIYSQVLGPPCIRSMSRHQEYEYRHQEYEKTEAKRQRQAGREEEAEKRRQRRRGREEEAAQFNSMKCKPMAKGTMIDSSPFACTFACPSSLMVLFKYEAYSKSNFATLLIPTVGTCTAAVGTPHRSLRHKQNTIEQFAHTFGMKGPTRENQRSALDQHENRS